MIDDKRYDIRIYSTDAVITSQAIRRAIRSIRKILPTLAEGRISLPIVSLFRFYITGRKETATIEHVDEFGEITHEKANKIIGILTCLGLRAKAIDTRWSVMK